MLDPKIEKQVESVNIPPSVAWVCDHCRSPFTLQFFLPDFVNPLPRLALQLLKLTRLFPCVHLGRIHFVNDVRQVRVLMQSQRSTRYIGLGELEKKTIESLVVDIYHAGDMEESIARLFSHAAFKSRVLENLYIISKYMLNSKDLDLLHHIFLTGLTAGYGLGYNRAALFSFDPVTNILSGEKAIGSLTLDEAEHIWEIIESKHENIEAFIKRYMEGDHFLDSSLQGVTRDVEFKLNSLGHNDELRHALAQNGITVFNAPPLSPTLKELKPGQKYLLAPVRSHNRLWGLVFMDNAFNEREITDDIISMTELFINQTALIWENYFMLQNFRMEARMDYLTGVANRTEMEKILDYLFSIEKPDLRFYLILTDIDNFKEINDQKGHAYGDKVLVEHSRILKSVVRGEDFVARYGGDEFLIIIREVNREKVGEIANRLREQIKSGLGQSISVGVACYPSHSRSRIELFQMADKALYEAKRHGKDKVVFYSPEQEQPAH